jgi:hypothetical protein
MSRAQSGPKFLAEVFNVSFFVLPVGFPAGNTLGTPKAAIHEYLTHHLGAIGIPVTAKRDKPLFLYRFPVFCSGVGHPFPFPHSMAKPFISKLTRVISRSHPSNVGLSRLTHPPHPAGGLRSCLGTIPEVFPTDNGENAPTPDRYGQENRAPARLSGAPIALTHHDLSTKLDKGSVAECG